MAITAIDITYFQITPQTLPCDSPDRFEAEVKVVTTTDSTYGRKFDLWIYQEVTGFDPKLIYDPAIEVDHGTNKVERRTYKLKCDGCVVKGDQPEGGGRENGSSDGSNPTVYAYVKALSGLTAQSRKIGLECIPDEKSGKRG